VGALENFSALHNLLSAPKTAIAGRTDSGSCLEHVGMSDSGPTSSQRSAGFTFRGARTAEARFSRECAMITSTRARTRTSRNAKVRLLGKLPAVIMKGHVRARRKFLSSAALASGPDGRSPPIQGVTKFSLICRPPAPGRLHKSRLCADHHAAYEVTKNTVTTKKCPRRHRSAPTSPTRRPRRLEWPALRQLLSWPRGDRGRNGSRIVR